MTEGIISQYKQNLYKDFRGITQNNVRVQNPDIVKL